MYKHKIHNPNNIIIKPKEIFCVIPFGHRCTSALVVKYASLRLFSLPFDWVDTLYPKKIQDILENDFKDFIPNVHNNKFVNKYNIKLCHFNRDCDKGIIEYIRRIKRFNKIIQKDKKIFFVYVNEDYIFSKKYRNNRFNNNVFTQMLNLEKFLKKKYQKINYTILYFNFFKHSIPKESNIINIVLFTNKIYDLYHEIPSEKFREYCGKILSKLFQTTFKSGYNHNLFNN